MANDISEFPCIEATRCLVTEKDMGWRLTVKAVSNESENYTASFTKAQSSKEEWYMHIEFDRSFEVDEGAPRRVLQLRHGETGQYLSCDENGRVTCDSTSSDSTWWYMKQVGTEHTPANDTISPQTSELAEPVDKEYILVSKKFPVRRLGYTKGLDESENFTLIASKNASTNPSIWTLKFTSGELCFIVNPVVHHQMRCNLMGHFSLTSQCNAWEVFRLVEVGNGDLYISSWTHCTKFLSSNSDGLIYSTDMESSSLGVAERWRLEAPPKGNGLYIRNVASRRYLSVGRKRSEHLWTTTKPNDYALWHLNIPHSNVYYLTSLFASAEKQSVDTKDTNQQYFKDGTEEVHISSDKNGPFLSQKREKGEEWKMEVTPEGFSTFFSVSHEKYLGCNSTGVVHTTTSKGAWTLWKREASPHGGVTFISKEHQRYLAISATDGSLCTTQEEKETNFRHSWRIDPRLPRIVSGGRGGYIADAMGLSIPVTIPFAVLGALEAASYYDSKINEKEENIDGPKENGPAHNRPVSAWKSWVKFLQPSVPPTSAFVSPIADTVATSDNHQAPSATEITSDNPEKTSNTEETPNNSEESSVIEETSDDPKEPLSSEDSSDNPNETVNAEVTSDSSKESSITKTTSDDPKEPLSSEDTSDNPNETFNAEVTSDSSKESSITKTTADNQKESSSTEATSDDPKDVDEKKE